VLSKQRFDVAEWELNFTDKPELTLWLYGLGIGRKIPSTEDWVASRNYFRQVREFFRCVLEEDSEALDQRGGSDLRSTRDLEGRSSSMERTPLTSSPATVKAKSG
jgi:hypothetical protein